MGESALCPTHSQSNAQADIVGQQANILPRSSFYCLFDGRKGGDGSGNVFENGQIDKTAMDILWVTEPLR